MMHRTAIRNVLSVCLAVSLVALVYFVLQMGSEKPSDKAYRVAYGPEGSRLAFIDVQLALPSLDESIRFVVKSPSCQKTITLLKDSMSELLFAEIVWSKGGELVQAVIIPSVVPEQRTVSVDTVACLARPYLMDSSAMSAEILNNYGQWLETKPQSTPMEWIESDEAHKAFGDLIYGRAAEFGRIGAEVPRRHAIVTRWSDPR